MASFGICVGRRLENPWGKLSSSIQWKRWDYSESKYAGNAGEGGLPGPHSAHVDSTAPGQAWAGVGRHGHAWAALRETCNY